MSNGKVKCTCGWSWNKSDSSKKDMYICHECGRDNSNNMKNGGWLDSYEDGGTMQEHQENYNDASVSLPEGFVGMGNNTKGRNYSPAWGGQFEDGGLIPMAQNGRATRADSLAVYNNAKKVEDFYNSKNYKLLDSKKHYFINVDDEEYYSLKNILKRDRERWIEPDWNEREPIRTTVSKGVRKNYSLEKNRPKNFKDIYSKKIDKNKIIQRERSNKLINLDAPPQYFDFRIQPQTLNSYRDVSKGTPTSNDKVEIYKYDPLAVKPFDLLTDAEKKLRVEKYGTDGVPKSYLSKTSIEKETDKPVEVKPQLQPKVEALNIQPVQQAPINLPFQEIDTRPRFVEPKSFNIRSQRQTMSGPSDYYNYTKEGATEEEIMRAIEAAKAYNADIERRYGNEEALKNPKAAKRLKQLRQDVEVTPVYQMGGYVYPVNYVPKAQMGGSIPGSVGFTYARTKGIPSEGPYAKKTMPSAQEGKTITIDEGDGKTRKILTDSKEYADLFNQGKIGVKNDDESISMNPLNEVVVTPYDKQFPYYQALSDEEKKYFNSDTPIGRAVRRKAYTKNSLSEDVTDIAAPVLYGTAAAMLAPYALAPLAGGLEFAGAAAAPYIEGALATSLPGMSSIPGATVGNAINAGFAGHGLYNIAPDAAEMYKNPSWSNAGNVGMDVLEIGPVAGPAGRMIGEGISTVGRMPKQLPGSSTVDYANPIKNIVTTFKNRNKKLVTVGAENLDKELLRKIEQLESPEGFSRLVTQEAEMLKRDFPLLERIIDVENIAVSNAHTRISELYQTALQGNFNRNYLEAKKLNPGLTPKTFGIPTNNAFFRQGLGSSNYSDNAINLSKEPSLRDNVFSNTYYNAELPGEIAIGREYAEGMPVYDHEINHALQNSRNTTLDDLLRKYFNNSENISKNLSEKTKKAYNYFRKNKNGMPSREPSSFLAEARRSMLERGLINDIYEPMTPKKVFEAMKHFKNEPFINPYTEQSYHRIFDFADDHPKTLKFLSDSFNKLLTLGPIGLGAASQIEEEKPVSGMRQGGIIKDDMGQWAHPGEITEINSNDITMQGVPYPVLGISDTGDTKLMKPGKDYKFKGKKVTEFPMAKNGLRQEQKGLVNLDNLLNFTNYNTKQPGGWLDKY